MPRWSSAEVAKIRELYADTSNLEIASELNRSVSSVVAKAHVLGLLKSSIRLGEIGRDNVGRRWRKRV